MCPLYCTCHGKWYLYRSSSNVPRLPPAIVFGNARKPLRLLTFDKVHNPFRRPRETTSERPKVLRTRQFFALLTWKCASRHNMPQRRTLFEHLNFQRCSEADVLWTCWLRNVLRATTACTFWTSELPTMLRTRQFFTLLTSKCASHHKGAHFFPHLNFQKWSDPGVFCTFWLPNVLRATTACNFSSLIWPDGPEPTALASLLFDSPEPQIIGKTLGIFFLLTLSLLWSSLFFSSLWLFPSLLFICPYCRKFDF